MFYSYTPKRTCSHNIEFEIDNGIVKHVSFAGGCNGNLKALAKLVEGMPCEEGHKAGLGKFIKRNRYGYGRFSVQKVHKRP